MEHEYGKILWACSTSIYTYTGEPDTPKEAMTGPNGHLWKGRNEISENSSELSYHKKDVDADMSSYDRVINELKELYTSYIPTRQKMHEPVIKGNCKVTRGTRVIPIMEHEYENIIHPNEAEDA